ncbi:MAG TPA: hypothetical protein ENJ23_00245, partial [Bacteroidetes bacterium]|nr:hypothetical protein [Bacteroidota bacterium]
MAKKGYTSAVLLLFVTLLYLVGYSGCSNDFSNTPNKKVQNGRLVILADLQVSRTHALAGSDPVQVWAYLSDQDGHPVSGEVVHFTASLGSITPADTTNASGTATALFFPGQQPGKATITASYQDYSSKTVEISIDSTQSQYLKWTVARQSLLANGTDTVHVKVRVQTGSGHGVGNVLVKFFSSAGYFDYPKISTDSSGVARNVFHSRASRSDSVAILRVEALGQSAQTQILLKGLDFSLEASPDYLIADGQSEAAVVAILKEATSKIAIANARIYFATDLGTIPFQAATDAEGRAEVMLKSSLRVGTAHVVASYGAVLRDTVEVAILESAPAHLQVTVDRTVLPADNASKAEIRAVVTDASNNPVPDGTPVDFRIVRGSGTIDARKETQNGVAKNYLIASDHPDTTVVRVSVGGLEDSVRVVYQVGEAATLKLSADSTAIPADGTTTVLIRAQVTDASGNPVADGTTVHFETDIGDITPQAVTQNGVAVAQFSSSETGVATITASSGGLSAQITIKLLPGPPSAILLSYDPKSLGVKDSGRNQTLRITAQVQDAKDNSVEDGTLVRFSLYASPHGGERLSTTDPVPTVNGKAQVSLISGTRSGPVRVLAEVVDASGQPLNPPVRAISTEIMIFAGPPYIENVNDRSTSHLTVGTSPLNILGWYFVNSTAEVVAVVGDKYNNPVPAGTAVYFTTTGGVISTHTGYTDEEGIARVTIHSAQPYPTIDRFYYTFFDPNQGHPNFFLPTSVIPGPIPDFEHSQVLNSKGNYGENDGIARIMAVTEGVDATGEKAAVWAVTSLVFSGAISVFTVDVSDTALSPGQSAHIQIQIY